jgi:hypothetical protein
MINYNKYLTPAERAQCLKFGALMKCAEHNVHPDELGRMIEKVGAWYDMPSAALKVVAGMALVTGIPIGVAAHVIGNQITKERSKERELKEQIKYYQNTVGGISSGLNTQAAESQSQM